MHFKLSIPILFLSILALPGCHRDCECCAPSAPPAFPASHFETRIFRLAYITPDSPADPKSLKTPKQTLLEAFNGLKTPEGKISFEKRANSLVVRDTPVALDKMQRLAAQADEPPTKGAQPINSLGN